MPERRGSPAQAGAMRTTSSAAAFSTSSTNGGGGAAAASVRCSTIPSRMPASSSDRSRGMAPSSGVDSTQRIGTGDDGTDSSRSTIGSCSASGASDGNETSICR